MKKKMILIGCALFTAIGCIWGTSLQAREEEAFSVGAELPEDHVFTTIDEDGRIVEMDIEKLEELTKEEQAEREKVSQLQNVGGAKTIKHGVVNFKTKSSASLNTSYTDANTGQSGYTNGYYAADAAFLGYENGKVKFMLSGVVGLVKASEVEVIDLDAEDIYVSFYRSEQGILKHYVKSDLYSNSYSSAITVGEKQSYMKNDVYYYSYDGHYFYTDYNDMLDDYKANTRKNSINPNDPYYNYYQFISNRSKTSFSASDINNYVKKYLGSGNYKSSYTKMYEMGKYFIEYQNQYGANAMLMFGVAANESAFGTSNLARTRNNLFGHNAVDSDPGQANGYSKPQNSIADHAKYYVNLWYSTPKYTTYHGSFLGDKGSGMLSYASDPYWGEKAAHWAWQLDFNTANKSDVGKKTLVFKDAVAVNVRKEASTSSQTLYTTPQNGNMAFVLLDEVKGTVVDGSNVWYKIQLDVPLNSGRTAIDYSGDSYNWDKSYGYIHSSLLSKEVIAADSGDEEEPQPSYQAGDVNGDGKITPADYVLVKNHIMGVSKLKGSALDAADVNGDGKITPSDYVLIKNKIMGQ